MLEPEKFGLDSSILTQEQQRLKVLSELGLLEAETIPVFEEATQTAAHFLDFPICILGFLDQNRLRVRSAVGLSRIGLMNTIAQSRQMPRHESFCTHVVEKHQVLVINDTLADPDWAKSVLLKQYGIRAYLGAPLFEAFGHCLGAIAVMDLTPRTFTNRDIQFLELMARWSMSEFERNRLLKRQTEVVENKHLNHTSYLIDPKTRQPSSFTTDLFAINQVKLEILTQSAHELRTPLTSILGMAGVVSREIYGPLTSKQKEYLKIIQHSGQHLLSLVNEISELGVLDVTMTALNPTSVDIEMLCQQALNTLEEATNRREQEIRLSVEPGRSRIWTLDKDKVRQMLYHLVFSVINSSPNRSIVRIHVSPKSDWLNLAVSVSHPWLGDGLLEVASKHSQLPVISNYSESEPSYPEPPELPMLPVAEAQLRLCLSDSGNLAMATNAIELPSLHRESLRLLLSCHMAQLHGGQISIQGTPESGYRYIVNLPELEAKNAV